MDEAHRNGSVFIQQQFDTEQFVDRDTRNGMCQGEMTMISQEVRARLLTLMMATFVMTLTVSSALGADHTRDSLATVKQKVSDQQAVLVDVRELSEWDEGHVAGAIHLPLSSLNGSLTPEQRARLPQGKILYLHCKSGRRCLTAGDILSKQGFEVRCLKPGYVDLVNGGFQTARTDSTRP